MKKYFKIPQDYLVVLENTKTALIEVSEKALGFVKENILGMQKQEATALKQRQKDFDKRVFEYRNDFMKNCPYHERLGGADVITRSYSRIIEYYNKNKEFEAEANELNNLETLFDIEPIKYKALSDCTKELGQLKYVWDLVSLVDFQFASWSTTMWDKIDPDNLEMLVKNFQTNLCNPNSALNKEIKTWKTFTSLLDRVKNMAQVMPLVKDLNSEFMKDRHWQRLKDHIESDIPYDQPTFCLNDLIKLELHKHVDFVTDLVDSAGKEHKIEVKIKQISKAWEDYTFTMVVPPGFDVPLLTEVGEIQEFVDADQMILMGMLSQKDVEEFRDKVDSQLKAVRQVDQVIQAWLKVQGNWRRLEPIFIGSDDIKLQLPEQAKRFEGIDAQFKDMLREAAEDVNVVNCCTVDGRLTLLQNFQLEIELCEKSLKEYLGEKKKIFPRFYFASE